MIPESIQARLDELSQRVRHVQQVRGAFAVFAVALACLLGVMAVDLLLDPREIWMHLLLSLTGLAICLAAAGWWLLRPSLHPPTPLQLARHLETRHPELEERISTSLEFSGGPDAGSPDTGRPDAGGPDAGVSETLLAMVLRDAELDAEALDPDREIPNRSIVPWRRAFFALAALLLVVLAVSPGASLRLLGRALLPWSDIGNAFAGSLTIRPGDAVVLRDSPLTLSMEMDASKAPSAYLERDEPRSRERLPLTGTEGERHHYELAIPRVTESFRYRIASGRRLSAFYSVTAVEPPRIESLEVDLAWPDYTGWGSHPQTNDVIVGFPGSVATLRARFNKPMDQAVLWQGRPPRPAAPHRLGDDGADWQIPLAPGSEGALRITIQDHHGFTHETERLLALRRDHPPRTEIVLPAAGRIRLRPDALLRLGVEASDDVGIAALVLRIEADDGSQWTLPEANAARTSPSPTRPAHLEAAPEITLAGFDLATARRLRAWVEVTDNAPVPQTTRSRVIEIDLHRDAESQLAQELARQEEQARQELQQAMKALEAALAATREASPAELADQAAAAHAEMQSLEQSLSESALASLAEAAGETAREHTAPAAEAAAQAPLSNTPAEEQARRDAAAEHLAAAQEQLEALEEEIDPLAAQLRNLAELMELADRENRIAEAAASMQSQSEPAADAEPESAAARPTEAAEASRELAEAMSDLAEHPEAPGPDQAAALRDALEDAIALQQEDIEDQAQTLSPQAGEAAGEVSDELDGGDLEAALDEAREAAETLADLDAPTAEPGQAATTPQELADRQEQVADQLEALNEGDLQEALAGAQEALGEMAAATEPAERAPTEPEQAQALDQLREQQQEATADIGESVQRDPEALAAQRADAAETGRELSESVDDLAERQEGLRQDDEGGLREALEEAIARQQEDITEDAQALSPQAAEATGEVGEELAAGDLDAALDEAREAAETLADLDLPADSGRPEGGAESAPSPQELADRQERVADQLEALSDGDLEEALAGAQEALADMAADLAEMAESLAAAQEAAGQPGQAAPAEAASRNLQSSAQQAQEAARQSREGQPAGVEASQENAAQELGQASQSLESMTGSEPGPASANATPGPLSQALSAAAEAAGADSPGELQAGAQAAASALELAAAQARQRLGLGSGIPGLPQPGQEGGMQVPLPGQGESGGQTAQGPGTGQGEQGQAPGPGSQPGGQDGQAGQGGEGGGAPGQPGAVPPELARLGLSASDWSRLRGRVDSRAGRQRGSDVPDEYRELVNQYFERMARGRTP